MNSLKGARMGVNLGFIDKFVLVDGTAIEKLQVLQQSPIPVSKQLEIMLTPANEVSRRLMDDANEVWSMYPSLMVGNSIFKQKTSMCI